MYRAHIENCNICVSCVGCKLLPDVTVDHEQRLLSQRPLFHNDPVCSLHRHFVHISDTYGVDIRSPFCNHIQIGKHHTSEETSEQGNTGCALKHDGDNNENAVTDIKDNQDAIYSFTDLLCLERPEPCDTPVFTEWTVCERSPGGADHGGDHPDHISTYLLPQFFS